MRLNFEKISVTWLQVSHLCFSALAFLDLVEGAKVGGSEVSTGGEVTAGTWARGSSVDVALDDAVRSDSESKYWCWTRSRSLVNALNKNRIKIRITLR